MVIKTLLVTVLIGAAGTCGLKAYKALKEEEGFYGPSDGFLGFIVFGAGAVIATLLAIIVAMAVWI